MKKELSLNTIKKDKPILFNKKKKYVMAHDNKSILEELGKTRHFTPAAQE
jgi:hypothetical protein